MGASQDRTIATLNRLANEPGNLKQMGLLGVELSGFFANPGNICLGDDDGMALFGYRGHGVYEGHYLFSSTCRGKAALERSRKFLAEMFTKHGARLIVGETPLSDRAARHFTNALGFTRQGVSFAPDGRPVVVYHMERERWVRLSGV